MDEKKLASAIETRGKIVALGESLAARAALLAAAHAALVALKSFEAVMAEHESAPVGEDIARPICFLRVVVGSSISTIEGRLPPVERTPEVALRAMLRAYEAAVLQAAVEHWSTHSPKSPLRTLLSRRTDVLDACARYVARGEVVVSPEIAADYEARLRGDRPLDAPPMEAP